MECLPMNRSTLNRLNRLEETVTPRVFRAHRVIGHSGEEIDEKLAALKASGVAAEGDLIICRRIVTPGEVRNGPLHA
jgi:hypothetical protein